MINWDKEKEKESLITEDNSRTFTSSLSQSEDGGTEDKI